MPPVVRGGSFRGTIGTPPAGVWNHPPGTNPFVFGFVNGSPNFVHHHHHFNNGFNNGVIVSSPFYPPYFYPPFGYYSPFGWDMSYNQQQNTDATPNVVYVPVPESSANAQQQQMYTPPPQQQAYAPPPPQADGPRDAAENAQPTVLVFRNGHTREVSNYAIVGSTLYVLSGKNARIAIADLDVPATVRANEDRGVSFRVPEK
jgi:hypothetical protein